MTEPDATRESSDSPAAAVNPSQSPTPEPSRPAEFGGPKGLEPTRYGDWERKGRCVDF